MSDQQNHPDPSEETEGHLMHHGGADAEASEDDDTEGHRFKLIRADAETGEGGDV